jgi:hypothetical protein
MKQRGYYLRRKTVNPVNKKESNVKEKRKLNRSEKNRSNVKKRE